MKPLTTRPARTTVDERLVRAACIEDRMLRARTEKAHARTHHERFVVRAACPATVSPGNAALIAP